MDAATRFDTHIVGALPVICDYLERLQLGKIIDESVPWEGEVPLGTIIEVMVINRLLNPKAMFRIDDWAQNTALMEYFGLEPGQLNDDRLGRALERVAAHMDKVQAPLVLRMIKEFKLNVSQVHFDITSVELFGAYETATKPEPEPTAAPTAPPAAAAPPAAGAQAAATTDAATAPAPTYGHAKSGRKNVKQIQLGINVVGDGGVPVAHKALDGNTAEATTHIENLRRLRALLPKEDFLYIADSKLDTAENLLMVEASQGKFLCAGVFHPEHQKYFRRNRKKLRTIDYCPKSQQQLPPEKRDAYKAFETTECVTGKVDGRTVHMKHRLVFVWSEAKAKQEAQTRERHLAKIRSEFETVTRNLNKYTLKTADVIRRRLESARTKYAEGKLFEYELTEERSGKFALTWKIKKKDLEERKLLEGIYVLKSSLSKRSFPLPKLLAKYKEQIQVERRIHHLKGPLAVTPMFLEKPERMAGLLCVLVWALAVLALMERQVRRNLKGKPMYGLYPENRPSSAPTGPAILERFSTLCIVIMKHRGTIQRRLAQPDEIQQRLLRLLGIPPDTLQTFKRRCGM